MTQPHFLDLEPKTLESLITDLNEPKFRTRQVWDWAYDKRQFSPDAMKNIGGSLQSKLKENLCWDLPIIETKLDSEDGATKLLLRTKKDQLIETVILRYENRVSVCLSSQVGCRLACSFCQTGKLGFFRNLDISEILGQFVLADQIVRSEDRRLSHVVFMGMGEPLDNAKNVIPSVNRLIAPEGFGLSAKNVTISSSGIVPQIEALADNTRASLAISLHAPTDELRTSLMPINRRYDLATLKNALISYQKQTNNIVTIEYILIKDTNCGQLQAKQLVKYLHGLKAKINLIPFNPHPGLPYDRPSDIEIRTFQKYLSDRGYPSPVRYSKGLDVSGGCGQLAAKTENKINAVPERKNIVEKQR